mgnify:CR=1 FL=1
MAWKRKGLDAERALVRAFWAEGWAAVRVAGSGSSHYPSPDILAGNRGRRLAIEAKVTVENTKYFPQDEIKQLRYFANRFGAEAWIAVKFGNTPWAFFTLEDLRATPSSYVATKDMVELKGLSFADVVNE